MQTEETERLAERKDTEERERSEETETVSTEAETMSEAYREILNRTYEILCGESEPLEGEIGVAGISEVMTGNEDETYHVGYQLIDIDGNGIEELIIAEMAEGDWNNRILAMYTQKENEPILLAEGWVRNRFFFVR